MVIKEKHRNLTLNKVKKLSDEEVLKPDFASKINKSFKAMRPYFDVMSMYLTTDLNGEDLT